MKDNKIKDVFEELKMAIFMSGVEAIDDFLGYEHDVEEDKDVIDARMDEVLCQMPEEEINKYYEKYCGKDSTPLVLGPRKRFTIAFGSSLMSSSPLPRASFLIILLDRTDQQSE